MNQKFVRSVLATSLLMAGFVLYANAQTASNSVISREAQRVDEPATHAIQQKLRGRSFFLLSPRQPVSGNVRARRTTADLAFDPFNSSAGYISQGNPMGTGDSAYFPNGISTPSSAYLAIGGGNVGIGTTNPGARLDLGVGGSVRIRTDPGNDTTSALVSYDLLARETGGATHTWKIYTAPVGGGFGVTPNSLSIWDYPGAPGNGACCVEGLTIAPTPNGSNAGPFRLDGAGNAWIYGSSNRRTLRVISDGDGVGYS